MSQLYRTAQQLLAVIMTAAVTRKGQDKKSFCRRSCYTERAMEEECSCKGS